MTKKSKENKMSKTKSNPYGLCIVLGSYSWACGLSWTVADIPSTTPLEKNYFLFSSGYQSQIVPYKLLINCGYDHNCFDLFYYYIYKLV